MAPKKKRPLRKSDAGLPSSVYERYRDDPDRQMVAPTFVQLARKDQDDLDRSIAERTAKNKNFPALVAAAQKRAQAFNAEERIAELEADNARLRAALEEIIRDLDADMDDHALFARLSERIAIKALATDPYAAMPPELVEALRAYEKRMFSGDVRKLLRPTKKRKAKKKP
jgi:hypothetical protein